MNTDTPQSIDRTTPPPSGQPKDVRFPDYFETTLAGGLKLIVYEQTKLPTVSLHIVAHGGSAFDAGIPGRASMTADLLTKGTGSRKATEIVEQIEYYGASLGSGAGWDSCSVGVSLLSKHLEPVAEVLADIVRNATFPEDELERLRRQRLASILQRKANPSSLAYDQFCAAVYGDHAYAFPSDGTEASVSAMQRESLADCHAQRFVPGNCFIVAVGDVSPEKILRMAETLFGDWRTPPAFEQPIPPTVVSQAGRVIVVDRPNAVQSSIIVGHAGLSRSDPDFIPVSVMNTLFGGYFGSRLNLNLREDKGYTYGAHSRFDARMQEGPFTASAEVRNDVTEFAVEEILKEIIRMRDETVSEKELTTVRNYITGNFPIQIETPVQVAQRIITMELYGLEKSYYNTYNSRVLSVTADDVRRVAGSRLHPDRMTIVAAGKASVLRKTLERFGAVEVRDPDGAALNNEETEYPTN
jgi:zinc protease